MSIRKLFLFGGAFLLGICVFAAEDLGQKIGSYAVKDGKKVWEEDRFGNRTDFEYNKVGQLVNIKRSDALVSGNKYFKGLLREQTNASGATVKMNYDVMGRMIEKFTPGGKSEQRYDKYGRLVERKGAGEYPLQFTYTGWGELAGYTDGNGATTKFEYDQNGKLAKRIWPDGTPVKYGYANGRLVSKEEAGRKTVYKYDDYGRMIEEKITQGKQSLTTRMTYGENGLMSSITDGRTTVRFAYDRFGRKLMEDGPVGTITNMYDAKGRLTARQVQFKGKNEKFLTEYGYDGYDRIISVKSPSGIFNYTWTKDNKIATQSVDDKLVKNEYDQVGRLTSKTFGDTVLAKYEYDQFNRRVKGQYFNVKWDYIYDQYNQLIGVKNSKGDSYAYTYDSIGNRLQAVENGKIRDFSYNKLNQISNDGYVYDAWGNMTKAPKTAYKYDLKNRLTEVKKADGTVVVYEYDPLGKRIASTINNNKHIAFLMLGMTELARDDGKLQYHTIGVDLLGTLKQTGATGGILATNEQRYLYDGNGNVTACVTDGNITDKLAYEPFGKQISGSKMPFTFSSKSIDKSEMSYYGYRFYDNMSGKWLSRDLLSEQGGMNLYAFANNVALNAIDAFGSIPVATTVDNLIWDGSKWVIETTVKSGTTIGDMVWNGLEWLGNGIVAIGTTVGNAVWNGTKWVTETTVSSGVWIGDEMWTGAEWVYAKTMSIELGECGSAKWERALIPDAPLGFNFSDCCREHDNCYGTKCSKKGTCDSNFYNCMNSKVQQYKAWYRPGIAGTTFGGIFYLAVDKFGCSAYKAGQISAGNLNPSCD